MKTKWRLYLSPLVSLLLFAVALWVLHHQLQTYHLHDILKYLQALSLQRLGLAVGLTGMAYFAMTGYDALGVRYVGRSLAFWQIVIASFIGYAFSNTVGFSLLSGGSIRYRYYSSWGFTSEEIAKIVIFVSLSVWLGFCLLAGVTFLVEPVAVPRVMGVPVTSAHPVGEVLLLLVGSYAALCLFRKRSLSIRGVAFKLPSTGLLAGQLSLAVLDWIVAGSVLYVLLPAELSLSYPLFLAMFLLAQVAGLLSQVPGGLGVFETVMLLLLPPALSGSTGLGALIAFRGIYYLLPLLTATAFIGVEEILRRRAQIKTVTRVVGHWLPAIVPQAMAFATLIGGAILLFSGATPEAKDRLAWLAQRVPLPVIEASHFLGSLVGAALLILARGLQRRLDAAYLLTVTLLAGGVFFSLLKGLDYEEAAIVLVMLVTILPCRRYFYRKTTLTRPSFSLGWFSAIALVLLCSIWLGIFTHEHMEYSHELWWQFSLSAHAPRFLRASAGAVALALIFGLTRLFRPPALEPRLPNEVDLQRAYNVIKTNKRSYANLALLGDKALLFNKDGNAFLMFSIQWRSWVAMGDPVGQGSEWPELIWSLQEISDRYNGRALYYEVGPEQLQLYLDLGLGMLKLGEEARVPLEMFGLDGSSRKGLRYIHHRLAREGCRFDVIPSEAVSPLLPELRQVSEAWLTMKNTREKGFSMGCFDEHYLRWFPVGVVRQNGRITAFANIWTGAAKEEISIDLMRYLPDAPRNVMEYLLVELMIWGKQQGYRWFSLGMAPFSGLDDHLSAPLWNKLGAFVFRHGEHFYNFQGLRRFKEKFNPVWEPRYLASPSSFALPRMLADIASLISGGFKGILAK